MNTKRFLPLLLILFIFGCVNEKNKNDLENFNLKGEVRKVKQYVYEVENKFGEVTKDGLHAEIHPKVWNYNMVGYITSFEEYDKRGELQSKQTRDYYENGNLKQIKVIDSKGRVTALESYNNEGNLVEIISNGSDYDGYTIKIVYEDNGIKLKESKEYKDNKYRSSDYSKQFKNDDNYIIEEIEFNGDGEKVLSKEFINDGEGNILEEIVSHHTKKDGYSKNYKYIYRYNNNGDVISKERFNYNGELTSREEIKYNGEYILEQIIYNEDNDVSQMWTNKFDEFNNGIESYYFNSSTKEEETVRVELTYDINNNWIKSIRYQNEIPIMIIENEYEYY